MKNQKNQSEKTTTVPSWAEILNESQFKLFMQELSKYFIANSINYIMCEGYLVLDKATFGDNKLGLSNLIQICNDNPEDQYPEIIKDHFDDVFKALEFHKKLTKEVQDFSQVQSHLAVRLYDDSYIRQHGKEELIFKHVVGILYEVLVFDFPETIRGVTRSMIKNWQHSDEELMSIGKANVEKKYPIDFYNQESKKENPSIVVSDHFYSAQWLSKMKEHKKLIGKKGTLIVCPTRHQTLFYKIDSSLVSKMLPALVFFTMDMYKHGPGSLSTEIYWYYKGDLYNIPYEMVHGIVKFTVPRKFREVLDEWIKW